MTAAAGPIERAARRELRDLDASVRTGLLAQSVLALARRLDAGVTPRDQAALTRELRVTLDTLQDRSPARGAGDKPDELTERRERRITGAAAG